MKFPAIYETRRFITVLTLHIIHYGLHTRLKIVPILWSQKNPAHALLSYVLTIRFNILPSMTRFQITFFPSDFPPTTYALPRHSCQTFRPLHSPCFLIRIISRDDYESRNSLSKFPQPPVTHSQAQISSSASHS